MIIENNTLPVTLEKTLVIIEEAALTCEAYNNCCHIVQFKE